jgi:arsenate reductase
MKQVLFICTRNSARSQMAEGMINHDLGGRVKAYSAGIETSSAHPMAVKVMEELGIDISQQRSKALDEFADQKFDYVITLCSQANEACPVFFGGTQRLHMDFPDPAAVQDSEEEKNSAYRQVRDQIRQKVVGFLSKEQR